jgi:hypothetical protein
MDFGGELEKNSSSDTFFGIFLQNISTTFRCKKIMIVSSNIQELLSYNW